MKIFVVTGALVAVSVLGSSGSAGAVGGKGGNSLFHVFLSDQTCSTSNCGVVVTPQSSWKNVPEYDTCIKPVDPDHCSGGKHNYVRPPNAGGPWTIV